MCLSSIGTTVDLLKKKEKEKKSSANETFACHFHGSKKMWRIWCPTYEYQKTEVWLFHCKYSEIS